MAWYNKYDEGSKITWDIKVSNSGTGGVGSNYYPYNPVKKAVPPATEEEMIKDILSRTDERGFFEDMVDWLRRDAPRRLQKALKELHAGSVAYDRLCEVLYHTWFRTTERLERRMMLGPANEWVQKYFKDFPPR